MVRELSDDRLQPATLKLAGRWAAAMANEPRQALRLKQYLTAMLLVRLGALRVVRRETHRGQAVVRLIDERVEELYRVADPQLGADNERALVDEMLRWMRG